MLCAYLGGFNENGKKLRVSVPSIKDFSRWVVTLFSKTEILDPTNVKINTIIENSINSDKLSFMNALNLKNPKIPYPQYSRKLIENWEIGGRLERQTFMVIAFFYRGNCDFKLQRSNRFEK